MKTLYDLLGARPGDDAEGLRDAFRKAAKANHPDLHAGDPNAPIRFRQTVQAYDILRDAKQRATYDRLLEFEREQRRWTLARLVSCLMHNLLADAVAVVGLAVVLGGGCTLFAYLSKTRVDAVELAEVTARGPAPAEIAAAPPQPRADTTRPDELRERFHFIVASQEPTAPGAVASAANDDGATKVAKGDLTPGSTRLNAGAAKPGPAFEFTAAEPAGLSVEKAFDTANAEPTGRGPDKTFDIADNPSSSGLNTGSARPDKAFDLPVQQAAIKADADRSEKSRVIEPLDQDRPQSVKAPASSPEKESGSPAKDDGIPKSVLSELAVPNDRNEVETAGTLDASTGDVRTPDVKISDAKISDVKFSDVKMPETKTLARPRAVAKRQVVGRATFEHVSLENKNTPVCSGSCSDNAPPLFGVGF